MHKDFKVKDHSVSNETFLLRYDKNRHMFFTEPKPSKEILPSYYSSEDYISHTDNKRSVFEWIYQIVKRYTLSRKHNLIRSFLPKQGSLIDIGSGTGDFASYLSEKGWKVLGVEPDEGARLRAATKNVQTQADLPVIGIQYDCITMWHVLEHVYDLDAQLDWIQESLKKNGCCFIAVPNFESHDAQYYKEFWAAYDVPRHLYHFSSEAISSLFSDYNLEVVKKCPMTFDGYYVSLLSEKYKNGKMNFFNAFKVGWRSNRLAKKTGAYSSLIYVIKHRKDQK